MHPDPRSPVFSYSPARRTALVFCGSGAHGAYHAGVLRALQEAGVKIDIVAGHGVGAATAALAAIDGGARLWEPGGLWRSDRTRHFYGWKPLIGIAGWMAAVLAVVLLIPLFVLLIGITVFLVGFLLTLLGLGFGETLTTAYSSTIAVVFAGEYLPTIVPRLAMVALAALILVLFGGVLLARWRAPVKRRARGGWWWRLAAAPLDTAGVVDAAGDALWQLIRGAAAPQRPGSSGVGRRYAEVLAENLGQPGFRELITVATDLDARRDLVAALLREPHAQTFLTSRPGRDRRSEVLDLTGVARDHAFDLVIAGLTPPLVCDPALVTFATDSFWRGETHRLCDRPGLVGRLLDEVAAAGATQAIVVSAVAPTGTPHRLISPRLDLRNRLGEFLGAAEAAALRDALELARLRFDSLYVICPDHNPVAAFDFAGAYDEASDRQQSLTELMERAYEDAYRQFIEPVVGASGDQLPQVAAPEPPGLIDDSL